MLLLNRSERITRIILLPIIYIGIYTYTHIHGNNNITYYY